MLQAFHNIRNHNSVLVVTHLNPKFRNYQWWNKPSLGRWSKSGAQSGTDGSCWFWGTPRCIVRRCGKNSTSPTTLSIIPRVAMSKRWCLVTVSGNACHLGLYHQASGWGLRGPQMKIAEIQVYFWPVSKAWCCHINAEGQVIVKSCMTTCLKDEQFIAQ